MGYGHLAWPSIKTTGQCKLAEEHYHSLIVEYALQSVVSRTYSMVANGRSCSLHCRLVADTWLHPLR